MVSAPCTSGNRVGLHGKAIQQTNTHETAPVKSLPNGCSAFACRNPSKTVIQAGESATVCDSCRDGDGVVIGHGEGGLAIIGKDQIM